MPRLILTAVLAATLAGPAAAADWPQFRGPGRDGVARGETLAPAWPQEGPPVLWRRPLGAGYSGIAAARGRVYTMAAEGETEDVLCLDAATGGTLWRTPVGARFVNDLGDGPRSTPTLDGDALYAVSTDLVLVALAVADGAVRWRRDLAAAFGARPLRFGYSASPLVDGDLLIVDVGGDQGRGVVAFDKGTGEVRWSGLDRSAAHSSPLVLELGGQRQYVFHRPIAEGQVGLVALAPGGAELWRHPVPSDTLVMPLFVPPDRFFFSSGTALDGGTLVRVRASEGAFAVEEVWKNHRMRNHFSNSVLVRDHLYGFDNATLRCLDAASGEIRWAMRGFGKGSLIAAGDRLLVLGDKGNLALVAADPEAYRELGRFQAMAGRSWTAPTLADGRLYLRDQDELVSLDVSPRGAEEGGPRTTAASAPSASAARAAGEVALAVDQILARYAAARGGLARWRELRALELSGTYATFSQTAPFTLVRTRGDRYRLDHRLLGMAAVRARDREGPWWVHPMLGISEPTRLAPDHPYLPQLAREARFEPLLLDPREGVSVRLKGPGQVDGRPTLDLAVTLPDGAVETWMLDPGTYLEVAVEDTVHDFTQGQGVIPRRTFYSDFRAVDGLVLPHRVAVEFGARLEEMVVERVAVDPEVPEARLRLQAAVEQGEE